MGLTFIDRLKHGWNAFKDDKNINYANPSIGPDTDQLDQIVYVRIFLANVRLLHH